MSLTVDYVVFGLAALAVAWLLFKRRGDIAPAEARRLVQGGARLIDVRSAGEFASGHIAGAVNIPVQELGQRLEQVGPKDRPVVLYCASGARSAMAASMLKAKGWATVHNLGAMSRW